MPLEVGERSLALLQLCVRRSPHISVGQILSWSKSELAKSELAKSELVKSELVNAHRLYPSRQNDSDHEPVSLCSNIQTTICTAECPA